MHGLWVSETFFPFPFHNLLCNFLEASLVIWSVNSSSLARGAVRSLSLPLVGLRRSHISLVHYVQRLSPGHHQKIWTLVHPSPPSSNLVCPRDHYHAIPSESSSASCFGAQAASPFIHAIVWVTPSLIVSPWVLSFPEAAKCAISVICDNMAGSLLAGVSAGMVSLSCTDLELSFHC